MKSVKNITSILMVFALIFTTIPIISGNIEVYAASKPGQVKSVKVSYNSGTGINTITWKKVSGATGYQIYRASGVFTYSPSYTSQYKSYAKVATPSSTTYKDTNFKEFTNNGYKVRAYKKIYKTQYYNSKTKKWQNSKPKKKYYKACPSGKYKGKKTRQILKSTLYGSYSSIAGVKNTYNKKGLAKLIAQATQDASQPEIHALSKPSIYPTLNVTPLNKTIDINETYALSVTSNSTGSITYSSSNTNVATVSSSGVITGKSVGGPINITINQATKGDYLSASRTVRVTVSGDAKFDNYSLPAAATYNLSQGSVTFNIPSKSGVTWSSSNPSVAKLATGIEGMATPGKVYFVGAGTATLTATSKANGYSKQITITVINDIPVISDNEFKVIEYPSTVNIKTVSYYIKTQLPGEGFDITWISADPACIQINGFASIDSQNLSTQNIIAKKKYGNIVLLGTLTVPDNVEYTGTKNIKVVIKNTIYPINNDGSYTLTSNGQNWWCGDYKVRIHEVFELLPNGTTFRVNIPDIENGIL